MPFKREHMTEEKSSSTQSVPSDQESSKPVGAATNMSADSVEQPETRTRLKPRLGDVTKHPVVVFLGALVIAFSAGFWTFPVSLELTDREIVRKDCCIPKEKINTFLTKEAVERMDTLIVAGEALDNEEKKRVWLLQVLTFVQYINLEKNVPYEQEQKISAAEANIRYAFKDPSINVQAQKTLGVLKGLRSALDVQGKMP